MQTIFLAVVPILLILILVILLIAAALNVRKNPGLAGLIALIAAGFAAVVACCFFDFLRGG